MQLKEKRMGEQRRRIKEVGLGTRTSVSALFAHAPPPSPDLTDKGATAALPLPSSTHLLLLQFPETAEDLRNGLQIEVKSRKTEI
jgi:hypothetical protein